MRYSVKDIEQSNIKNYVETGQRNAILTPNKVMTKERTKSERFGVAGNEIQTERINRVVQDDNFNSKNSKIS